jgi:hypothetical protein
LLQQPRGDALEDGDQLIGVLGAAVDDCEVEILREPVGLVVALAQAGSALEDPALGDRGLGGDRGEHPAEDVVLFDDADVELPLGSELEQFLLGDHEGLPGAIRMFARTPHAPTRGPSGGASGSSRASPVDRRDRHAAISSGSSSPRVSTR